MAEFDDWNQTPQTTDTGDEPKQEDDLFGSDFTTNNTTVASLANPFDNAQQQQQPFDSFLVIEDALRDAASSQTNTTPDDISTNLTSAPQSQRNIFDDDGDDTLGNFNSAPLPARTTPSFDDQSFTNQFDTSRLPPTANDLFNNDTDRQSPENNSSFNTYTNPVSAPLASGSNLFSSSDPLQEFYARRQQELAEMEVIEKQKIEELRKQGKLELERWYEDRRRNMEQKRQSMKEAQDESINQALEKSDKQTCDWAKVIRLLDFSQGTQLTKQKRDINRMRAVIVQAKRDKEARKSENGV